MVYFNLNKKRPKGYIIQIYKVFTELSEMELTINRQNLYINTHKFKEKKTQQKHSIKNLKEYNKK